MGVISGYTLPKTLLHATQKKAAKDDPAAYYLKGF